MKINEQKGVHHPLEQPSSRPAAKNGGSAAPATGEPIHISAMSSQLSALEASLAASPEFDAGRVDAIKQAIRDGQFSIRPEAIADKLLANVEEFLKKPH